MKLAEILKEIQINNTSEVRRKQLASKIFYVLTTSRFEDWYKHDFDNYETREEAINDVIKIFDL